MSTRLLMTAEEFLALPHDGLRELVQGEVVELTPPGQRYGFVCSNVSYALNDWARRCKTGVVLTNDSTMVIERDPETVRGPDVQFIAKHRMGNDFPVEGSADVPPELVIEVVSESDRWANVMQKVEEFLNAGVREVWVVDPDGEFVEVFRTDSRPRRIVRDGLIESPTLLPGFSCSVSNFFAVY